MGERRRGAVTTIEKPRGVVAVPALGEDRFRISAPGLEQLVTGLDEGERVADRLASVLGAEGRAGSMQQGTSGSCMAYRVPNATQSRGTPGGVTRDEKRHRAAPGPPCMGRCGGVPLRRCSVTALYRYGAVTVYSPLTKLLAPLTTQ